MPALPVLTLELLKISATDFARSLGATPIPALYGVTDGKAVGTYVEAALHTYLATLFDHTPGNAAKGIDLPDLGVDIKVTSIRQPQSSCPFRDATQKIYGLGYNLLVFVYDKADDDALRSARLDFKYVLFIDESLTGDFQTTTGLLRILSNGGNVDDVDAFLEERHLPLDEVSRRELAARIVTEPPKAGCLTISNALQWRLQYSRAIQMAEEEGAGLVPWNLLA